MSTLNDFKSNLGELARPNKFKLSFTKTPSGLSTNLPEQYSFLVRSASIPSMTVNEIILPWQGLQAKIPGDPTFEDYTVNFTSTVDLKLREYFEQWQLIATNPYENTRVSDPQSIYGTIKLTQLDGNNEEVASYELYDVWVSMVGTVEYNQDSNDQVIYFDVTFKVNTFKRV